MRLALTHAYSWPEVRRGAERIIHELGLALSGRGHEVTVLTAGARSETLREGGVTTVRVRRVFGRSHSHERDFGLRILPKLVSGKFDAVHSLGTRDGVASIRASRRTGHRTVYTNLGNPVRWWWEQQPDRRAHRRIVRDVDVYGCMSQYALDALAENYGRTGALTPGGVDLEQFRPSSSRENSPTVLFSAALYEGRKGGATLLEAAALLSKKMPDLAIWLSGQGDISAMLDRAPAAARERVTLLPLGDPQGQAERYGRAWVTALPSVGDSFGMALIESLACGTPIVTTTDGAPPELVTAGTTGAVSEPEDPVSLAAALEVALDLSQRPATIEACRASAQPFDWRTGLAPRFEELYAGADA